jgi:CRP-like cAMP-binding protein
VRLTIEKVMILKTCEMFSQIPEDSLAEIAAITEEELKEPEENIFEKGEMGDAMYIIVYGKVKVHDKDKVFATLGERDIFGEMAVLDTEQRSASITALEETRLFRINQEPLYELLAEHPEVTKGIIRVLCSRLRTKQ